MNSPTKLQGDDAPSVNQGPLGPDLTGETLLGRYEVLHRLGAGGMGTVYVAQHTTIGKKFALKVLGSEFASRPDLVERFLREARAASMIPQQNVVEITDFGETNQGLPFFVMEYLEGEDLRDMLEREGAQPWSRIRHQVVQICRALEAAHDKGIVHRDMKPDNCFRIKRGKDEDFIKVLDFGIAKIQDAEGEGGKGLTQTGMLFGTPEYMSPEQAQGAKVDHRSDIYALGVIMYQLLTGHQPFVGDTFMAVLTKHMFETPVAPSEILPEAKISPEIEAVVLKAMQKDPEYRFQTMAEMIDAIEAVGTGADAVAVVTESIARPEGGPTSFATPSGRPHRAAAEPETVPDFATAAPASAEQERKRPLGLWIGLGGIAAGLAVVGYVLFGGQGEAQEPGPAPSAAAAPVEPETAPEPEPTPAATSVLQFATNVPAQVLDARDRAIYGSTADEDGIELPQSAEPLRLLLVAEGFEDLAIEVLPDRPSKRYGFELIPVAEPEAVEPESEPEAVAKKPRGKGKGKVQSKTNESAESGDDMPKAAGPKLPSKGGSDGEIKNPFGN